MDVKMNFIVVFVIIASYVSLIIDEDDKQL